MILGQTHARIVRRLFASSLSRYARLMLRSGGTLYRCPTCNISTFSVFFILLSLTCGLQCPVFLRITCAGHLRMDQAIGPRLIIEFRLLGSASKR